MRLKTALKTMLISVFFLVFFHTFVNAQFMVLGDTHNILVNATINTDLYSQVSLVPPTVEIRQPSNVNITILTPGGVPRPNRTVVIYISGYSTGISITQPGPTNSFGQCTGTVSSTIPGTYTVCTKDVTEGFDIFILDCETLYVVPVPAPFMLAEPPYTIGTSNIVMWNTSGTGTYQYYVEVSRVSDFSVVERNSGWINGLSTEFTNLSNGQMYFYRVKARNAFGGESAWSNVVFSVQDSTGPEIQLISISGIGNNTVSSWEKEYTIDIKYRIKDNFGISSREFWCVGKNGDKYNCAFISTVSGDFYDISIKLKDLEPGGGGNLLREYVFCAEAKDIVGNVTRNCEAKLNIPLADIVVPPVTPPETPVTPTEPVKPKPPAVQVAERVSKIVEDLFDNTVGKLEPQRVQEYAVTTTTANVTVGVGFLLTILGNLPYFIIQVILGLLSLLGFRKKGNITGYVYNSLSKEPVSQAIVRVFNESHELIWTDVTDSNGYFRSTDLDEVNYYIKVTARNYSFPSKIVFGKTDFPLENVYNGELFEARDRKIPNFSIPMDQSEVGEFEKRFARFVFGTKALWKSLHILLFLVGLIFSFYALTVTDEWWNYLIIALYLPALISLIVSLFSNREKYGFVKDEANKIVEGAIVALNETDFGKLVSKRVTDYMGRYRFIVNKGFYEISILNSDLRPLNTEKLKDIEIEKEDGEILSPNIKVKRLLDDTKGQEIGEPLKEL
jgi:hypothetical protein